MIEPITPEQGGHATSQLYFCQFARANCQVILGKMLGETGNVLSDAFRISLGPSQAAHHKPSNRQLPSKRFYIATPYNLV